MDEEKNIIDSAQLVKFITTLRQLMSSHIKTKYSSQDAATWGPLVLIEGIITGRVKERFAVNGVISRRDITGIMEEEGMRNIDFSRFTPDKTAKVNASTAYMSNSLDKAFNIAVGDDTPLHDIDGGYGGR